MHELVTTESSALCRLQTIFFCNPNLNLLLWLAVAKNLNSGKAPNTRERRECSLACHLQLNIIDSDTKVSDKGADFRIDITNEEKPIKHVCFTLIFIHSENKNGTRNDTKPGWGHRREQSETDWQKKKTNLYAGEDETAQVICREVSRRASLRSSWL